MTEDDPFLNSMALSKDEQQINALSEVQSEREVLAACLNIPAFMASAARRLDVSAFWSTTNMKIFDAMKTLHEDHQPVGVASVVAVMRDRNQLRLIGNGADVVTLSSHPFTSAEYALSRVIHFSLRRQKLSVAQRMAQAASDLAPEDMDERLAELTMEMDLLAREPEAEGPVPGLSTWEELLSKPNDPGAELIPNLLNKQEAVMILGAPGAGKSWLSRQVSWAASAGMHPFRPKGRRFAPVRTLLIDLENPEQSVKRQSSAIYRHMEKLAGRSIGDYGHIWLWQSGMNIRRRKDQRLFERAIMQAQPQLVCIGSLYNLYSRGKSDWDTATEEVIEFLKEMRGQHGVAFWLEHHMPKAQGGGHTPSPFGSSLWERWPTFGRTLGAIKGTSTFWTFSPFRGDREADRDFPAGFVRGGIELPWFPIWEHAELEDRLRQAGLSLPRSTEGLF